LSLPTPCFSSEMDPTPNHRTTQAPTKTTSMSSRYRTRSNNRRIDKRMSPLFESVFVDQQTNSNSEPFINHKIPAYVASLVVMNRYCHQ
jgi:hypothetical protein